MRFRDGKGYDYYFYADVECDNGANDVSIAFTRYPTLISCNRKPSGWVPASGPLAAGHTYDVTAQTIRTGPIEQHGVLIRLKLYVPAASDRGWRS